MRLVRGWRFRRRGHLFRGGEGVRVFRGGLAGAVEEEDHCRMGVLGVSWEVGIKVGEVGMGL